MTFTEKLQASIRLAQSTLCVGLDPNLDRLPVSLTDKHDSDTDKVAAFLKTVIDVTADHCAAYKPNLGFFEALGPDGWDLLADLLEYIPKEKIVIADAKRGDISSTAEHYAKAFFEQLDVDSITLNPLMGFETLTPFLGDTTKGIYVLTLTSNPGAEDILKKKISGEISISSFISRELQNRQQQTPTAIGMVVGATQASDLEPVIRPFPEAPLLIPGVGKQGGSIKELAEVLTGHQGLPLINSSRSILYAGGNSKQWSQAVEESAKNLKERLAPITNRYV